MGASGFACCPRGKTVDSVDASPILAIPRVPTEQLARWSPTSLSVLADSCDRRRQSAAAAPEGQSQLLRVMRDDSTCTSSRNAKGNEDCTERGGGRHPHSYHLRRRTSWWISGGPHGQGSFGSMSKVSELTQAAASPSRIRPTSRASLPAQ